MGARRASSEGGDAVAVALFAHVDVGGDGGNLPSVLQGPAKTAGLGELLDGSAFSVFFRGAGVDEGAGSAFSGDSFGDSARVGAVSHRGGGLRGA